MLAAYFRSETQKLADSSLAVYQNVERLTLDGKHTAAASAKARGCLIRFRAHTLKAVVTERLSATTSS